MKVDLLNKIKIFYILAFVFVTLYLGHNTYTLSEKVQTQFRTIQSSEGEVMLNEYVLSAYLAIAPTPAHQYEPHEAWNYAGKALYIELGMSKYIENLEKRVIPVDFQPFVSYTGTIIRLANDKKITYAWEF